MSDKKANSYKFQFHFNEIIELSANINIIFRHEIRSTNFIANVLAKQGVDRLIPWVHVIM